VDKFIIKFFGINKMNFWGWVCAGLLLIGLVVFLFGTGYSAFLKGDSASMLVSMLVGIGLLLLGIFGLLLQLYCGMLAEKLERQQARVIDFESGERMLPGYQQPALPDREEQPRGIRQGTLKSGAQP
jgi:hypothetical protein